MVAGVIGVIVLILLWTMISSLSRSFASTRDLLGSLQGAHLLVENVRNDLASMYFEPGSRPLEVSADFFDLKFLAFDPETNESLGLSNPKGALEQIHYRFDPQSNLVSRNGSTMTFARFEKVIFFYQSPDFTNPLNKRFGNYVTMRVTCAPDPVIEQNRTRSDADRITKNVVTLITSVSLQHKAAQELFPVWNRCAEPTTVVE
jgi:hypothetical protein